MDAALDEELRFHLDMETDRLVRLGVPPGEARRRACLNFGPLEAIKETYRDRRGFTALEAWWRDLAHAGRNLRRHPGFTLVAVISLALGIGANTAVFSLIDAFVLRPLPYPEPERLLLVFEAGISGRGRGAVGAPVLRDWRERSRSFTAMGAFMRGNVNVGGPEGAERMPAASVEPQVFETLGVAPLLGRPILPENVEPGRDRIVVLSHALWIDRFDGRRDIVGHPFRIDGVEYEIAGVMPPSFEFPPRASAAVWVPLGLREYQDRGLKILSVIARTKPEVSLAAARHEMASVSRQLEEIYPNSGHAFLIPLHIETVGRTALVLIVMGGAVGLVLLLACSNVAHMVLARANARRHEFAVRLALGASRRRILRLLLIEGFILAAAGAAVALAACRVLLDAVLALADNPLPPGVPVAVNGSVLAYCAIVAFVAALGVSLLPALRLSGQQLQSDLAESVPSSRRRTRHGNRLITVEAALAMLLVIGAAMLGRSLLAVTTLDLGFRPDNILTTRLTMPIARYPDTPRLHMFYDRLEQRVSEIPGVEAVGLNNLLPIQMSYTNMDFTVEGWRVDRPADQPFAEHRTVSHDFFRAMGIPIVSGRAFTREENRRGSGVIVVSQRAAATYWPNADAVGKRIAYGTRPKPDRWLTVIGVAGDIRSAGLGRAPQIILYAPYRDFDYPIRSISLVLRTTAAPASAARALRAAVRELDPDLALYWVSTMEQVVSQSAAGTRFMARLLASFSGLAVLLAIVGVYGVMSYVVSQRQREMGVRLAMGASRVEVLRFVLGLGMRRTLTGVAIGAFSAISLSVMLRPFLIGIGQVDVVAQAGAAAMVVLVALVATAIPAYRASQVDPIQALRHE
jgi:putative ABC transport system permease protein